MNWQKRIYSSLAIGMVFIYSILYSPILFLCILSFICIAMLIEWHKMASSSGCFHVLNGYFIIIPPIICLAILSNIITNRSLMLLYFCIIWSVDTFAMIGGKFFKGPRLAPFISPGKTWSGLISGIIAAMTVVYYLTLFLDYKNDSTLIILLITFVMSITAQLSDLFISYFKRKFGVKDSGFLIPGHGGVLDRFDSIILTAPLFLLWYIYIESAKLASC